MTRASDWQAVARDAFGARAGDDVVAQPPIELLAIELDGASYALPVERVREIVRPRCLTPVPRTPDWVLGVVALLWWPGRESVPPSHPAPAPESAPAVEPAAEAPPVKGLGIAKGARPPGKRGQ